MNRIAEQKMTDAILRPVLETTSKFYLIVALLGSIVVVGLSAWFYQVYNGLGVTGDNWPVFWGFHETNFVFWIGISPRGNADLRNSAHGRRRMETSGDALRRSHYGLCIDDWRAVPANPFEPAVVGVVADSLPLRTTNMAELPLPADIGLLCN